MSARSGSVSTNDHRRRHRFANADGTVERRQRTRSATATLTGAVTGTLIGSRTRH